MSLIGRLYRNDFHIEFIARRRIWYLITAVLLTVSVASMLIRGFSAGIEFSGGAVYQFPSNGGTVEQVEETLSEHGIDPDDGVIQQLETSGQFRVQTPTLSEEETRALEQAFIDRFDVADPETEMAVSTVGSSWGSTITRKAVQGLLVFLLLVTVYLAFRFEWKMAVAAMAALLHDLVVTMGVYSLVGFEVTPSTIIAVLTILGFSLYDTVVVFDRVRENTAGMATSTRRTYAEAANDALNETVVRSLNTSVIAVLPVGALLFVGAGLLGAGTLKDLALAQFVGVIAGTFSSLFLAAPLLVDLKRREPAVRALDQRVARARANAARARQSAAATAAAASAAPAAGRSDEDGEPEAVGVGAAVRPAGAPAAAPRPGVRRAGDRRPGRRGRPSGKKRQ